MSCLNYDGRGRYLEAIWHALMAIFQFLALALFYFGSFLSPGYIPGIKHWPIPDDDDRKVRTNFKLGLVHHQKFTFNHGQVIFFFDKIFSVGVPSMFHPGSHLMHFIFLVSISILLL